MRQSGRASRKVSMAILMMDKIGECECGAVSYRVTSDAVHIYACHCLSCQTRSSSAFGEHAMVHASDFVCNGTTVTRSRTSGGIQFNEVFCDSCLSRVYNRNSLLPDMIFLRAGTLADSQELEPIAHIWTKRKQRWVVLPEDVPSFEESPTPEQFGAAVQSAERRQSSRS